MEVNCVLLALATIGVYSFFFQLIVVVIQSLCYVFVTPFFLSLDSLRLHGLQHARLLCPSLSPDFAQIHIH